jgi:hypothetical protein
MGSNYFPSGPHGERQAPWEVPLHPGDKRSNPQPQGFDFPAPAPFPVRTDSTPNASDFIANKVCSFLLVFFCWPVWACLYPMPTLAGLLVFLFTLPLFQRVVFAFDRTFGSLAIVLAFIAGMIVLVKLSRVEHWLARWAVYRWPRHLVRTLLLTVLEMRSSIQDANIVPRPGEPLINPWLLHNRQNQVIMLAFIVITQLLLWRPRWLRRFWHGRLEAIGLRPRDLA